MHGLESARQPATLVGTGDMHEFGANGSAVGRVELLDQISERGASWQAVHVDVNANDGPEVGQRVVLRVQFRRGPDHATRFSTTARCR